MNELLEALGRANSTLGEFLELLAKSNATSAELEKLANLIEVSVDNMRDGITLIDPSYLDRD